ncbi:inovirus Gp2 family protein [Pantoea agglomerans]|uniref:inovirus Gp2 family protein n=1 Tax=Enterobacter agglomerans TaxID=549 RepID=UPI0023B13F1D|nr:inovirus Gp2 family protein [Pantoea agglomerans]WEC71668.1 inovirus Gp2 family protein [Pantoea agglomerans]
MTRSKFGPLNQGYMKRMSDIISKATKAHARTAVFTFILRLPEYCDIGDSIASNPNLSSGLMERFTGALRSRIAAHQQRRKREKSQVCPTELRYLWVREVGETSGKDHYHVAIFVNKDTFRGLGNYSKEEHNLGSYISAAWLSALDLLDFPEYRTLATFTNKPHYLEFLHVDRYGQQYLELRSHLSYFAKEYSKVYDKEERSFGGSVR